MLNRPINRRLRAGLRLLGIAAIVALTVGVPTGAAATQQVPKLGDSKIFDTWTGYQSGRYLAAVVAVDLNGDGKPDTAWARNDFFQNGVEVQLNLGDGTLGAATSYPAQAQSNDIAAGDLDGDGDQDLVVVSQGNDLANSLVDVYLNDGTGAFTHRTVTGGQGAARVALADLNGDGKLDVALTDYWGTSADVAVLLGKGDGTFAAQKRYQVGSQPHGISAVDLDGDGDRDLAVARHNDATYRDEIVLLRNDGVGAFSVAKTLTSSLQSGNPVLSSADVDLDGKPDLVLGALGGDTLAVLHNDGNLAFSEQLVTTSWGAVNVTTADVDGDADLDILAANGDATLLRNAGNGTFGEPIVIETGRNAQDVGVADFDADGRLDLAVANRETDTGGIHPQRPDGSFAIPPISLTTMSLPLSVATADFDRDGRIDVAEGGDGQVAVLLNAGGGSLTQTGTIPACSVCRRDVTATVGYVTASDLNGDGAPDLVWAPNAPPYPYVYTLNNGNGTFGVIHEVAISTCGTGAATTADVDNDGDQDILVANDRGGPSAFCDAVSRTVRVALNNGGGTFQTDYGVEVFPLPEMAVGADLTGDGKTDIVAASANVSVARGTGGGAFAAPTFTDARGTRLKAVDLDGDTDVDVATADLSTSTAYVLKNDGTGALSQIKAYPGEQISGYADDFALDIGDIDGDGVLDLVVANPSGYNAGVHFGLGGGVFANEQVRYGTHNCLTDVRLADMNGDGKLDIVGPACVGPSFVTARGVAVLVNKSTAATPGAIAGKVKDRATGAAIAGATVDCGSGGSATTGSTGRYRIKNVPAASYTCKVGATGYKPLTKTVTVTAGQTATASFALRKA